jgi:hypothetical protein
MGQLAFVAELGGQELGALQENLALAVEKLKYISLKGNATSE